VVLGILQAAYNVPVDGYKIYSLTVSDLNALGKHLDEEAGQEDSLNRCILDILEKVAQLEGLDETNRDMEEVAIHANEIRNFFFDSTKHLNEVIPPVLLARMSYKDFEVQPRRLVEFTKSKLAKEDSVAKEQINIRVSSRGQTGAKEAAAPAPAAAPKKSGNGGSSPSRKKS